MAEVPLQPANKYGTGVDDDLDRFADMLNGGDGSRGTGPDAVAPSNSDEIDENFFKQVNSERKYGG